MSFIFSGTPCIGLQSFISGHMLHVPVTVVCIGLNISSSVPLSSSLEMKKDIFPFPFSFFNFCQVNYPVCSRSSVCTSLSLFNNIIQFKVFVKHFLEWQVKRKQVVIVCLTY